MSKKIRGAEAILESLIIEGVDTVFGYPGGAIMPTYDALFSTDKLQHILTRHEQGAVHAADGYAQVTGKAGVVIATSGPGATNLVTGICNAMMDSTPLVCFTGQVISQLLGTDAFQEADIIGLTSPITKWNYQITKAGEIPKIIAQAFYIATTGRPGPVVLDITKDAQIDFVNFEYKKCTYIRSYTKPPVNNDTALAKAAELINKAKQPMILNGHGVLLSGAENEVIKLAEKGDIPIASTILGLSAIPSAHPLNVGMLGMHGNYSPNMLTNQCDLIIAIGMRFDDRVTGDTKRYAKQAKVIHIEVDPSEVNKIIKADVALIGEAKELVGRLIKQVEENNHKEWRSKFQTYYELEDEKVLTPALHNTGDELNMGEVVNALSRSINDDSVLVTDVGQNQMFGCRFFRFKQPRSNITSGGLGTMGFALPAGMGAKLGRPDRPVTVVTGDGGFQMNLQELATIVEYEIDIKIVILNNNFLGMVRQWQEMFFEKRYSMVDLQKNPDFQKVSEAFGLTANTVSKREELNKAIDKMYAHKGPYLLNVMVAREENVFPMIPPGEAVDGILLDVK